MPKGMTPKKRMMKTTVGLARALKSSGKLNKDDIKRAGDSRKKMSLSEIRNRKKLGKVASKMGVVGSIKSLKEIMKKSSRKMIPLKRKSK